MLHQMVQSILIGSSVLYIFANKIGCFQGEPNFQNAAHKCFGKKLKIRVKFEPK